MFQQSGESHAAHCAQGVAMFARKPLLWNLMLPIDDDAIPGDTDALDMQLERQLARFEGMSPVAMDDPFEDGDDELPSAYEAGYEAGYEPIDPDDLYELAASRRRDRLS
jgi:hypothetical protein